MVYLIIARYSCIYPLVFAAAMRLVADAGYIPMWVAATVTLVFFSCSIRKGYQLGGITCLHSPE